MSVTINLQCSTLTYSELQYTLVLQLDSLEKGLPYGISLDKSKPIIPFGAHSNIFSTTFSLHVIDMGGSIPLFVKRILLMILLFISSFSKVASLEP